MPSVANDTTDHVTKKVNFTKQMQEEIQVFLIAALAEWLVSEFLQWARAPHCVVHYFDEACKLSDQVRARHVVLPQTIYTKCRK